MTYTVTSPLVIATAENGSQHHLYQGSPIPPYIGKDEIKRLADEGHISEKDEEPTEEPTPEEPVSGSPKGNASRDEWAAYATSKGAPVEETRPVEEGGLKQTELREKYSD
jgi:hypothetical protein